MCNLVKWCKLHAGHPGSHEGVTTINEHRLAGEVSAFHCKYIRLCHFLGLGYPFDWLVLHQIRVPVCPRFLVWSYYLYISCQILLDGLHINKSFTWPNSVSIKPGAMQLTLTGPSSTASPRTTAGRAPFPATKDDAPRIGLWMPAPDVTVIDSDTYGLA
jgi:hypothetical protein